MADSCLLLDKSKGFGFVEFEEAEDAKHAIDNLHKTEFFGRVLAVNYAKPDAMNKNTAGMCYILEICFEEFKCAVSVGERGVCRQGRA